MTGRRGERRQHRVAELDLDAGALGDEQRVVARLLVVGEQRAHLGRRLQVELVGVELEALRVGLQRAGLHAQQRVVCFGVVTVGVVRVVGGEQGRAHVARQLDQLRVDLELLGQTVVLQLDEERVAPEDRLEALDVLLRERVVAGEDRLRHRATEAAGGADEALVVLLEQVEVDTRLLEEAVEVRARRHLDEVLVSLRGLGEQGEVVDVVLVAPRPVVARRGDHVGLGADDRGEVGVARGAVEVEDAVHVPVVGDADRGLPVGRGGGHHLGDARGAVEHRELGVQVEVHERLGQCRACLPRHFHTVSTACG